MHKSAEKQQVALSSVLASLGLTLMKLIVGLMTGSLGILSEAAHSLLDFFAAGLTYYAVKIGDKPPDKKHPYGHGKIESVSALVETALLFITSIWIIYEAIHRLTKPDVTVETTWYSFLIIIISIIVDISRSRALKKVAQETKSQALEADALHFSSDILSSGVVLMGLISVAFGFQNGDAIAAIGVSIFVLHAGYSLGKRTIDVLVDAAPQGLIDQVNNCAEGIPGLIKIDKLRVRPVGAVVFVDMTVTVHRGLPLERVHEITDKIEQNIRAIAPEADITISTKPGILENETIIQKVHILAAHHNLSVHDIVIHKEETCQYVSYDIEVPDELTIQQAHEKVKHFENEIKKELGNDIEISSHIEPFAARIIAGATITPEKQGYLISAIQTIADEVQPNNKLHKIFIRTANKGLFITLHMLFPDDKQIDEVHTITSRLEYLIRTKFSEIQRVVIHAEPESQYD